MRHFLATATLMLSLAATAVHAGDTGIAECDDYIAKQQACLEKVPADVKPAFQSSLDSTKTTWAKFAANPAAKENLKKSCISTTEGAKVTMKSYGCEF